MARNTERGIYGGSPIEPSPLPRISQVSLVHWPQPGWKARTLPRGSIAIPLPAQEATFSALGQQMHHMRVVYPAPRWTHLLQRRRIPNFLVSGKRPSRLGGPLQIPSAVCNVGLAVFRAIQRRCEAWPHSRTPWCPRPSRVTRQGPTLSVMTVNAWWWGLNVYAGIRPFPPALARFPTVGHPSCPLFCCHSVAIQTFLAVPLCISEAFRHVFCLPSIGAINPEVDWLPPKAPACQSSCTSSPSGLRSAPPECPGAHFVGPSLNTHSFYFVDEYLLSKNLLIHFKGHVNSISWQYWYIIRGCIFK
jgi:hypothetical protein